MSGDANKLIVGPVVVERIDMECGGIRYELVDMSAENYHIICAMIDLESPKAKHEAEFMAKAINTALGIKTNDNSKTEIASHP